MPDHTPAADRSRGGPGSSHENGDKKSARTRKGDRAQSGSLNATGDSRQKGDAHGHHAAPDQVAKDNRKAEQGGKP